MALSKADILDAIAGMTVLELSELIKDMEEKFGVSAAAAAVAVAAPAAGGAAAAGRLAVGQAGRQCKPSKPSRAEPEGVGVGWRACSSPCPLLDKTGVCQTTRVQAL